MRTQIACIALQQLSIAVFYTLGRLRSHTCLLFVLLYDIYLYVHEVNCVDLSRRLPRVARPVNKVSSYRSV